jgi:hypothetical protein
MKARCLLTNMTDLAKAGARETSIPISHAPFRVSQIAEKRDPRVQAFKAPPKDRCHRRETAVLRSQRANVLVTHSFANNYETLPIGAGKCQIKTRYFY